MQGRIEAALLFHGKSTRHPRHLRAAHRHAMITVLRQLLAIAILPFTVAVLVPVWIARRYGVALTLGRSVGTVCLQVVGLALLGMGLVLFIASVRRFATEGKG